MPLEGRDMSKLMITLGAGAAIAVGLIAPDEPAAAQSGGNVAEIIVYGNDPCPRSTDDQVVVCARRPESERFRIPERYRQTGSKQAREAWAVRSKSIETVGATGINSCSPVGPAGYTGCLTKVIKQARQERREDAEQGTPPEQ
jgi:hypothetical protein